MKLILLFSKPASNWSNVKDLHILHKCCFALLNFQIIMKQMQYNIFVFDTDNARTISWAPNQQFRMISEISLDAED